MTDRRYIVEIYQDIIDIIVKQNNSSDLLALYLFYNLVANRQHTNKIKALSFYCQKVLKIGHIRFFRANKKLQELGLVKIIKSGKGNHWYIEIIDRVWKKSTKNNDIQLY